MFSDLECDYINPIDLCNQLNRVRVLRSSPVTCNIRANVPFLSLVCPTRIRSACLPRFVFPALGSMVGAHVESTASSIQCPKVRQSPSIPIPINSAHSLPSISLTLLPFTESCPKATSMTQRKSSERFHNTRRRASSSSTIYTGTFALSSSPTSYCDPSLQTIRLSAFVRVI